MFITVTPVNDAPVVTGNPDATTDEGGSVTTDVLSNATDADGDPLTIDTQGTNGLASVNSDGTITYTHDGSETTSDSYTYTIRTVTIDTQGTNGLASVNSDGTITYTHDGSETTSDSYTYTISDGNVGSDSGVVHHSSR